MTRTQPKPVLIAFIFSALLYLVCLSFISYPLTTLLKPIPIACLIIAILQSNMLKGTKVLIAIALGFSLIGDIVLTLPIAMQIELGIGSFLLAHCCYIAAYIKHFKFSTTNLLYFSPIVVYSALLFYAVFPHLGALLIPVCIYFSVLLAMVFCAFQVTSERLIMAVGAVSFLASDSILSYSMFVLPQVNLSLAVMITYYLAQLLLTIGLIRLNKQI